MTIFNQRDLKRLNKNSPVAKIEDGYTHVLMIPVPKDGYPSITVRDRTVNLCRKLYSVAGRINSVKNAIGDIMFQYDLSPGANHELSNECGRLRHLCERTYGIANKMKEIK